MKNLLLILSIVLCLNSQAEVSDHFNRTDGFLHYLAEKKTLTDLALRSVIGARCSRYMPQSGKAPCLQAVTRMIQLLDYDVIFSDDKAAPSEAGAKWSPRSFVFVAFKTNLISLLSGSRTSVYLKDLNQKLYEYLLNQTEKMNIWDITKSHFKTDYMSALVIASLFQDTSRSKLHLAYLDRAQTAGGLNFRSNKELVSRVIDTINLILDSSEDHYKDIFYPGDLAKNLNKSIYHFYVPLFISKSLAMEGIKTQYAFSAATMLTVSYEFITSSNDYRYLYLDPGRIQSTEKIRDIFAGYCGSNFGVRGLDFNQSFEDIQRSFENSSEEGVQVLLDH